MPTTEHETLIELFRNQPTLPAELLGKALGVRVPTFEAARLEPGDATDLVPTEYRADAVTVMSDANGPVLAAVVEVQLGRDKVKRWSWPVYLATLRARLRCPTELLVVCTDRAVAAWCTSAIELGLTGSRVVPLVVGPERVPVLTDAGQDGTSPELVVLSALSHGGHPDRYGVLDTLLDALPSVDQDHQFLYLDLVYAALPAAARAHLEELLNTKTSEELSELGQWFAARFKAEGKTEGKAEGKAEAVLVVLDRRGIAIPGAARARISKCTDIEQLDTWLDRALTARTIDDVIG